MENIDESCLFYISDKKITRWNSMMLIFSFLSFVCIDSWKCRSHFGLFVHVSIDNDRKFEPKIEMYLICAIWPEIFHRKSTGRCVLFNVKQMMQRKIMRLLDKRIEWICFDAKMELIAIAYGWEMSIGWTIQSSRLFANIKLNSMLHFSL